VNGTTLLRFARAWFDEATVSRVFEPLVADWQRECADAAGLYRTACWLRGYASFTTCALVTFAGQIRKPLPTDLSLGAWSALGAFFAGGLVMMHVAFAQGLAGVRSGLLLPAHAGVVLPLAVAPAVIILASRTRWPGFATRRAAIRLVILSTVLMFPLVGWVTPGANQRWRTQDDVTSHGSQPVARGPRELTLVELAAPIPPIDFTTAEYRRREEFHTRFSVIMMPVSMGLLGLAVARVRRHAVARAFLWWGLGAIIFLVDVPLANTYLRMLGVPPFGGWVPHLALLLLAAAMHGSARRAEQHVAYGQPR
jgi:hypothetical protein